MSPVATAKKKNNHRPLHIFEWVRTPPYSLGPNQDASRFRTGGILLWGAVTNILYFLPAQGICPSHCASTAPNSLPLEVAFQTRDESASGGPKTDGLLIATGVISLLATFYSAGCLLVLSGRRATVRGATLTLTPLCLSVTCVILMLFSALATGLQPRSGFFIKVIEVAGIVLIYTIVSEASVPRLPLPA